jgi:mRNA interferase RelE/StbE
MAATQGRVVGEYRSAVVRRYGSVSSGCATFPRNIGSCEAIIDACGFSKTMRSGAGWQKGQAVPAGIVIRRRYCWEKTALRSANCVPAAFRPRRTGALPAAPRRIREALGSLEQAADSLRHPQVRALTGELHGDYRLRVGGWRVLFTPELKELTLFVYAIVPRGEAYRCPQPREAGGRPRALPRP